MAVWRNIGAGACPPLVHRVEQVPSGSVKPVHEEFLNDQRQKTPGVAALVEEVRSAFLHPLAKRAKITIWPPTLCQPIGGPNSMLERQPSKEFDF